MSKFHVGDRVRVTEVNGGGLMGTVLEVLEGFAYEVLLDNSSVPRVYHEDYLRPADIVALDELSSEGTCPSPSASVGVDMVQHPPHYTRFKGFEVIDITENFNFNRGCALKYIMRAGLKDPAKEIEDLKKAAWYIDREINRLQNGDSA